MNGTLFFQANDGTHGAELWRSNGSATGTVVVKDISPGTAGSYPSSMRYRFQAFTRGNFADAEAKVGDNSLKWGFRVPQFGVRYTIRLNDKGQCFEIGEVSRDGKEWQKFFEMTLDRAKES